jgi:predicted chitinase
MREVNMEKAGIRKKAREKRQLAALGKRKMTLKEKLNYSEELFKKKKEKNFFLRRYKHDRKHEFGTSSEGC